jgi:hypothetical protein
MRAMLAGMAEKSPSAVDRDGASSDLVGLLWRDGDFRHAAGLMDKLGDRLSPGYFHRVRAWPPGALSQIRAMTSARSTELYAAEEAAARGDADAAAKAYRQAAAALPKDHPGQLYIAHRARALELRKPLLAGEWADLKPTADLAPFSVLNGSATADENDGSLVVTANQESVATLQLRLDDVGPTYELRAKVDFPDKQRQGNACLFGQCWSDKRYVCGGVGGAHQTVFAINWKVEEQPAQLKGGDTLTLRVNGGTFDVLLGDRVVFKDLPVNPRAPKAACYPGLGINGRDDPGFVVRFHDIQIRRLNANNGG